MVRTTCEGGRMAWCYLSIWLSGTDGDVELMKREHIRHYGPPVWNWGAEPSLLSLTVSSILRGWFLCAKLPLQVSDRRLWHNAAPDQLAFWCKLTVIMRKRAELLWLWKKSLWSFGVKRIVLHNIGSMPLIFLCEISAFHFSAHSGVFWVFATCDGVSGFS